MVETIRYSKIYADDIAFGTGTKEITLTGGEVVEMEELNITHLITGANNQVLYASSDGSTDDTFIFDPANDRLLVPEIAGADTAAAPLTLKGTSHATPGVVALNPSGGSVGIGIASPDTLLHVASSAAAAITIDATGADASLIWALAGTETWYAGIDQSDSNKFKLGAGGVVGTNPVITVSSSSVGIGATAPSGTLHVRTGTTTSTTPSADADDAIVESNGDGGISIVSPNTNTGALRFARPADPLAGFLTYNHSTDRLTIGSGGSARATFTGGSLLLGTTTVNSFNSAGITIDQGTADDQILSFRSSDVAHGVTDIADTSTYGFLAKFNTGSGGVSLVGFSEATIAVGLTGVQGVEGTTTSDTAQGAVALTGFAKSGTGTTAIGAANNLVVARNDATTVFIIKGDGDVANSGGATAMTAYDDYDDVQLLQTVKGVMAPNYRATLGEWVEGHTELLERTGVITRSEKGWFISQRGWRGLLIDAIAQLSRRIAALEQGGLIQGA